MKRLLALLRLNKAAIRHYRLSYLTFFLIYFALLYGILYHINGLSPFQHNIHFFSNVTGSLFKRALSEMAPYLLIFYLLFNDTKQKWLRGGLIVVFDAIFLANLLTLGYYFVARANFQYYILKGFEWHLFFTFLTPVLTVTLIGFAVVIFSLSDALYKIRAKVEIPPLKKWLFALALLTLAIGSPFLPVPYSTDSSIRGSDQLEKAFYRTVELENSGLAVLVREASFVLLPPKKHIYTLTPDEQKWIESEGLNSQIQKNLPKPFRKIVLIVMESMSQQFLSAYNDQIPGNTPELDTLLSEYPHLDAFYPSGAFTLHGLAALLCGHTNLDQTMYNPNHDCVPEILGKAGYATEFIRGATKYYVEENLTFKKFGYDTTFAKEEFANKYPDFIQSQPKLYKTWGYTDYYTLNEVALRLRQAKPEDKLFLTALTLDTHSPGGRCSVERQPGDPEDPTLFSAHCFDRLLKEFMDTVDREHLLTDDTAIILAADHPYPAYYEIPGANFQTSFLLEPTRIPLILLTKDKLAFKAQQGSQVDLAATLLNLANHPAPPYYMGKSLLSNPHTTPMGQDRKNGYMIVGSQFHSLSLNSKIQKLNGQSAPNGPGIALADSSQNNPLPEAQSSSKILGDALFKWYYNQYFNLE